MDVMHMHSRHKQKYTLGRCARQIAIALLAGLLASCATPQKTPTEENAGADAKPSPKTPRSTRLTLALTNTTLGEAVRKAGQAVGGPIAIAYGTEELSIADLSFVRADARNVAYKLAEKTGLAVQACPHYYFLFPAHSEALTQITLAGQLGPTYQQPVEQLSFGTGFPLYAVFDWISQALGVTVVGDSAVGEVRCGEMALRDIPLDEGLEAILKSARAAGIRLDVTDEYVFFLAKDNPCPASALLNGDALDNRMQEILEKRVNVCMPRPPKAPGRIELVGEAEPLSEVLPSLSQQLGIPVVAEKGLGDIPINPAALNNVRVRTAMDLLIRQWLTADYGYQITHDRIVIQRRPLNRP